MKEQIVKLVERFPDRKEIIESLAGSNTRFRSLLQDHHDVHRKLARDEVSGVMRDVATRDAGTPPRVGTTRSATGLNGWTLRRGLGPPEHNGHEPDR